MTLFFSITALFLSAAVAVIAWQQWRVADNKLRLDLFDRRYKVYNATRNFVWAVLQSSASTDLHLPEFNAGTSDADFLFESDVVEYIKQIRKHAVHLLTSEKLFEPLPVGDERSRYVQAAHDDRLWLNDQVTAMTKTFAPYLGFANVRFRALPFLPNR